LREKGVRPDTIAALMVERSLEMIVGLLAILKAGGAYLPIDPAYPQERIDYMLKDSNTGVLVSEVSKLSEVSGRTEVIDLPSLIAAKEDTEPTHLTYLTHPTHLCYIIYTSGSTGRPKGVMLEHKNVVNLLYFDFHYTNLDFSKVLQFHTIGFDASFHEIFSAFLSGGHLVLIREEARTDIAELSRIVEINRIPTLFLPMSFLRIIFSDEDNIRLFPRCVRHIQTAGEQVVINHLFRCFLQENRVYLHNHYGPAETHVVTALTLDPTGPIPELPSIGKPLLNTVIYILDRDRQLLPVGVPGELWISGCQVGRGYLNNPELTAERFDQDLWDYRDYHDKKNKSFCGGPGGSFFKKSPLAAGGTLYKTGDLARWTAGGDIEFLGRIDTQVKIRGFRIEPGEIESRLTDIEDIKEAAVIDRTDEKGEKYLCAYVVADSEIDPAELRDTLTGTLPDYMVPSYFVQVEAIPLSPNGKVKKSALPRIEGVQLKKTYAPPRTEVEKKLCRLWSEVLGIEEKNIGIDDNFFQLGGHSLRATILIAKIYKTFNVRVLLGELFDRPFIRGLARLIADAGVEVFTAIEPVEKREYYPMSSAQKRMYIINQLERGSISYNMPAPLLVEGDVDGEKFTGVFRQLIRGQEGLRTGFEILDGQPVQRIHDEISFEIEDCSRDVFTSPDDIIKNFIRPFDLSRAPLMRVGLARLEKEKYLLVVDFHHIIGDGVSMGVLIREFTRVYGGKEIAPLRIQYRDYAVWQESLAKSGELKRQEEYWLKQLSEDLPPLNLPLDYPRPAMMGFSGRWVDFEISSGLTGKLKKLAEEHGATLYMVLLAAYNVLLHKYTGRETIVVGSVIAGRSYNDLENIIGVFLNTQAMKNNLSDNLTFERFLDQVRENALRAYENQDYQFEELVEKLKLKRDYSRNPLFDTMLNFINMDIPEIKLGGLKLTLYKTESEAVKLDIKINAREEGGMLRCTLDYSGKLFNAETMESFIGDFIRIIDKVGAGPGIKIADIPLLSREAEKEMIADFSEEIRYEF
jgi:amino acid adenylation domain-containing protein